MDATEQLSPLSKSAIENKSELALTVTPMSGSGLDFIIAEYQELWRYYHKTLDERNRTFGYYFRAVGIPSAIVLAFSAKLDDGKGGFAGLELAMDQPVIGLLFMVIGLIGISSYFAYCLESDNSRLYIRAMAEIRRHVWDTTPGLAAVNRIDKLRARKEGLIKSRLPGVQFFRGLILVLLNSAVLTAGFSIISGFYDWLSLSLTFILCAAAQILLTRLLASRYR